MANYIELVEKYLPVLDEQYRLESRSAILDYPKEWVQDTKDAKKVKIAKIRVDKLGNYSRQKGFVKGSADLTWEEHEFTQDRGRAIQVDHMDNQETFGMSFGRLAGRFQKDAVIPELDAYRFATYYKNAGTKLTFTVTSGAILKLIDNLDAQFTDNEVGDDAIIFANPTVYNFMINDPQITKHINVSDSGNGTIHTKIYMYDNHMIVKVPSKRFYTDIVQYDGETGGQEVGGYVPADDAQVIGLMMVDPNAVVQISKRAIARVWAPNRELAAGTDGVNPDADAWKFDFRIYHDAWVLDEKIAGIAAAIVVGDAGTSLNGVKVVDGVYDAKSGTGTWTAGNAKVHSELKGTTIEVSGEIPYKAASDSVTGLGAGNRYDVRIYNANITAKSQLPDGNIGRVLTPAGTWTTLTKDAFQDDGSYILSCVVNNLRVGAIDITWATGETVTYTINTLNAKLAPSA